MRKRASDSTRKLRPHWLDELEAFDSLVAGMLDAVKRGDFPSELKDIVIVEQTTGRARRIRDRLSQLQPDGHISRGRSVTASASEALDRMFGVGYSSERKPHIFFVAMPFSSDKSDHYHYHYGIQNAGRAAGLLCERVDTQSFTGDILDRIKDRIATSRLLVADLSGANPNVYLEVGYAWGKGVLTVLGPAYR